MGTSVETAWNRFRRQAVTPYWCQGDPLAWWDKEASIGIAHLAMKGEVGHFNLAWWFMARTYPPSDAKVYANTPLGWVILHAPTVLVSGSPLTEWASRIELREWNVLVHRLEPLAHRLEARGITYSGLLALANMER